MPIRPGQLCRFHALRKDAVVFGFTTRRDVTCSQFRNEIGSAFDYRSWTHNQPAYNRACFDTRDIFVVLEVLLGVESVRSSVAKVLLSDKFAFIEYDRGWFDLIPATEADIER